MKNKNDILGSDESRDVCKAALDEFKSWKDENQASLASKVYEPLYKKNASKTETAHFLSELLSKRKISPEEIRSWLPPYIVDAIDYVTGNVGTEKD